MDNLDWALVRSFLAVAETGSLSAAGRKLNVSQPTLGRHIKSLEETLGCEIFIRKSRGFDLTKSGEALLDAAQDMAAAAGRLSLTALGEQKINLKGTVRLTASEVVAHYQMPRVIAQIRKAEPDIQIELVASDTSDNLLYREADIAIRMFQPKQLDVVAKRLGDAQIGLYGTHDYFRQRGVPTGLSDLRKHDFVGYDRDERIIQGMRALGIEVTRNDFSTRCDSQTAYWELVKAGCGIGVGQVLVGDNDPTLRRVFAEVDIPPLPVWLAAPEALHRNPRIRRVWDLLSLHMAPLFS